MHALVSRRKDVFVPIRKIRKKNRKKNREQRIKEKEKPQIVTRIKELFNTLKKKKKEKNI